MNAAGVVTLPIRLLFFAETEPGPLIAAGGSILLLLGVLAAAVVSSTIGLERALGLEPPAPLQESGQLKTDDS